MKNKLLRSICATMLSVAMIPSVLLGACSKGNSGSFSGAGDGNPSVSGGQNTPDIIGIDGNGAATPDDGASKEPAQNTVGSSITEAKLSMEDYAKLMSKYLKPTESLEIGDLENLGISNEDYIWTIVSLNGDNLIDRYNSSKSGRSFSEYSLSEGVRHKSEMLSAQEIAKRNIREIDKDAEFSYSYTVVDNGFAVKVKYGNLDKIRKMSGVKSVRICEEYDVPDEANTTLYSSASTGTATYADKENHYLADTDDYMGEGMLIAVLDTGLDVKHPAFKGNCIDMSKAKVDTEYIDRALDSTIANTINFKYTAKNLVPEDVYYNNKLVYRYDYGNYDKDVIPMLPDLLSHGTHTTGIAVGYDAPANDNADDDADYNLYEKYGEFRGVAPQAQLAFMKIFYENVSDYTVYSRDADIAAAIEDSIVLGADVINLSLGSPRGFSVDNSSEAYIYMMCNYADLIGINVQASVGNNFTGAYAGEKGDYPLSTNPDYGSANAPATYNSTLAVGSYNGENAVQYYAVADNGVKVIYTEKDDYSNTQSSLYGKHTVPNDLAAGTYDWVVVKNNGSYKDFTESNVSGKIALVRLNDKVSKLDQMVGAIRCEAKALIFVDSGYYATRSLTTTVNGAVPFMGMSLIEAEAMTENWTKTSGTITFSPEYVFINLMSDFSSWGVTDTLNIAPDIIALGGNVYSSMFSLKTYGKDEYGYTYDAYGTPYDYTVMSGTSMAAPMVSGYVARLRQKLAISYPELSSGELSQLVNALFMSTAKQLSDQNGNLYSPRQQGAGLIDYDTAKNAQSYITVTGQTKPKIEVGEDPQRTGVYVLNFNLNNLSDSQKAFKISLTALTDSLCGDGKTVSLVSHKLEGFDIQIKVGFGGSITGDTVTVPANGKTSVAVEIRLTDANKKYLDDNFKYGSYVEGFIWATEDGGDALSVPYLAFYGDWEESAMIDSTIFDAEEEAYLYATRLVGSYYYGQFSDFLGKYPYVVPEGYEPISYDADRLSVGSHMGGYFGLTSIYLGLLRNADSVSFNLFNQATGESYINTTISQIGKASYVESYATMYPVVQGLSYSYGSDLNNNTVFTLSITATKNNMGTTVNVKDGISFDISVDNEAPKLYNDSKGVYTKEDGTVWISLNLFDNFNLSCIGLYCYTDDGETLVDAPFPIDLKNYWKQGEKNTWEIEITKYIPQFTNNRIGITLEDSAMNNSMHVLTFDSDILHIGNTEESGEEVKATSLECNEFINIATNYSSDLGVTVQPYNATYTISVDETAANTGRVEIDEARKLVIAREAGAVTVKIQSGDIVKYCTVNIYVLDGEWVYSLITTNGNAIYNYNEATKKFEQDRTVAYDDELSDGQKYYKIYRYLGNGSHVDIPSEYQGGKVIDIGYRAISYSTAVYKIKIPNTVRNLWYYAFAVNPNLTEIEFEENSQLKEIGSEAFEYCTSLEKVNIPASVIRIGSRAFNGCTKIKELTFESGSVLRMIESDAFNGSQIEELNLPNTVETIGTAFVGTKIKKFVMSESLDASNVNLNYCSELTEVQLSSISTASGSYANCPKLKSITLPEGVQSISSSAFQNCVMLTSITLPDSVKTIGSYAFSGCARLVSVRFGNNSEISIGDQAFAGDSALHTVYFNKSTNITKWGTDVFSGCVSLDAFSVNPLNTEYMSDDGILYRKEAGNADAWNLFYVPDAKYVEILTIRPDVKKISDFAFIGHSELKSVLIPEGGMLESIGQYAFAACPSLSFINLENASKLNSLGAYAFAACSSLTSVSLPDSLTVIPQAAFMSCLYLEKVTFGNAVKNIGASAFYQCIRLKGNTDDGFVMPATLTYIGTYAFYLCNAVKKIDLSNSLTYTEINEYSFVGATYVKEIILPSTVTKIGSYAFAYLERLESINLEDTRTTLINNNAFYGDSALKSVTLPNTVEDIRKEAFTFSGLTSIELPANPSLSVAGYAFAACADLEEIILPDTLKKLEGYTFAETAVREVRIPNGLTRMTLSEYAFNLCNNLERFIVDDDNPYFGVTDEGILYIKAFTYNNVDVANTLFIVPINMQVEVLDLTDKYAEKETDRFDVINSGLFFATRGIEKVIIPSTITSIGVLAFYHSSVKEVVFAEDSYIDFSASKDYGVFAGCYMLEKITLPAHLTTIPEDMFSDCSSLKEIILPSSVTYIAYRAFAGCESLESINLENVQVISASAFKGCSSLKEITLGRGLYRLANTINELPFEGCSSLERVIVDENNKLFKEIDGVLFDKAGSILYLYPAAREGAEYSVPSGVTKINELAFGYNKNLKKIILPESLATVGTFAFYLTEQLDTYVFLSKHAPALESQFYSATVGVIYANFYNLSQLEFDYPLYCVYPENGEGYDLWIYRIFFFELTAMTGGEDYSSPSQSEIPKVEGPEISETEIDVKEALKAYIDGYKKNAPNSVKSELDKLYAQFETEYEAYFDYIAESNFGSVIFESYKFEADRIYAGYDSYYSSTWAKILTVQNKADALKASGNYSDAGKEAIDNTAKLAKLDILEALSELNPDLLEEYYEYYMNILDGIPTLSNQSEFEAKIDELSAQMKDKYEAIDRSLYDEDVLEQIDITYNTNNVKHAVSLTEAQTLYSEFVYFIENVYKKSEAQAFKAFLEEQLARLDVYKAEDYDYYSEINNGNQWQVMDYYVQKTVKPKLELLWLERDIKRVIDDTIKLFDNQYTKLYTEKQTIADQLDTLIYGYNMYFNLYDAQKKQLSAIVSEVKQKISSAATLDIVTEEFDAGFKKIWEFYEYNQKAHLEYLKALEAFENLSAEVKEQAMRELNAISYRVAGNAGKIAELVAKYTESAD